MDRRVWYVVLGAVVIAGVYWYWTKQGGTQGGTSAMSGAIQQDLAYYQAWQDAQAAAQQPSGQNANPANVGGNPSVIFGTPIGAGAGTTASTAATMSLPVNA